MRLLIAAVGKLKQGPERELYAHYLARTKVSGKKLGLFPVDLIEVPESKAGSAQLRRDAEGAALVAKAAPPLRLVALDPAGNQLDSEAFASLLAKFRDAGAPGLAFVIGGADGLGQQVLEKAERTLSLGPMTLPHGLARIVLAEQLYRATTILAGHPYHRGGRSEG
ncbi:MAG: 23S rRNA (pseudouridine(1915)-N(3))-methyltransferase RlmH [Methyloceanibacter sp.]|uniref:23S rRNA (pseudouridine(1915)-N(3))-methyltransferase RlmH n=1 Tax=Methyloceanibacter sp. TaxID=1965321 RepID=UPI003D9AFE9F